MPLRDGDEIESHFYLKLDKSINVLLGKENSDVENLEKEPSSFQNFDGRQQHADQIGRALRALVASAYYLPSGFEPTGLPICFF